MMSDGIVSKNQKTDSIKLSLRWAALFLGELRDGLTMASLCVCVLRARFGTMIDKSLVLHTSLTNLCLPANISSPRPIVFNL